MNQTVLALPKLDLHCHLDGSLNFLFVKETLAQQGELPDDTALRRMLEVSDDCASLAEYLERFALPIRCMRTPAEVMRSAYTFVESLQADNVRYVEVRFAPALLQNPALTERQAIEGVLEGLRKAKDDFGIASNLIICGMRHLSYEQNLATYRLAREYYGAGVCALDLAGDEAALPNSEFAQLFQTALSLGMPYTIHAGECGSAASVRDAIELGARRIGHGIAMRSNPALQRLCAERRVGVEMCPVSNFHTKAVTDKAGYPVREFLQNGVLVTINTDNRTVSNTTIGREFALLTDLFGFTADKLTALTKNAILCSFADDNTKDMLLGQL